MLGLGDKTVCSNCHSPQDAGGKTAVAMRGAIDQLRENYENAHAMLTRAEHSGMEVSQPLFDLNEAKTALIKARAAIHAFNLEGVKKETQPGLEVSQKARSLGMKVLDELQFRRNGLLVSALILLALIVGLVLKIRQMERKSN